MATVLRDRVAERLQEARISRRRAGKVVATILFGLDKLLDVKRTVTTLAEALEHFVEDPKHYSAVVLDLAMPVMDGAQTLKRMKSIDPDVYVILSTGYTHEYEEQDLDSLGFSHILRKPYPIKQLLQVLKRKPDKER